MLAQKFIAICDHGGCNEKTKATVIFSMGSSGVKSPVALQPDTIKLSDGWTWGWNSRTRQTEVKCKEHGDKRK
jgi:hypothetical protein